MVDARRQRRPAKQALGCVLMQSPCEVVDRLLRNRPPFERVGLNDHPWGDTLRKWTEEEDYPTNENGGPVAPADHFGFDMAGCGGWFDVMPKRGFSEIIEETDEWKTVRNGAGAVLKWWKNKSGTPEHIDFSMSTREVWDTEYRHHLLEFDAERMDIPAMKRNLENQRAAGKWTFFGHQFIWETLRASLGDVCMFESLVLDPSWIHDFNRVYTDFYKMNFTRILAEAGLPYGIWIYEDLGYRNGLACSPMTLAELVFPYYAELVEFFHGYDLPVVLHACGNITEALPLIVEAGFDGLNPMEVKAGCDIFAFAETYGDRLAFFGGLDARILETGDADTIRKEVTDLVEGMKARGARYIYGSDHSISTNVTLQAFRHGIDVYREHMAY